MDPAPADLSRRDVAVRLGGGALAALLLAATGRSATAQDATPVAAGGATGTTAQLLGAGEPLAAPGLELTLRRIVHAPGGRVPAHSHPGALVIWVESGSWGYTPLGGMVRLTRAAATDAGAVAGTATPGAQPFGSTEAGPGEELPLGTEVILTAGDWLFVEDPEDDVRNAGDDDVVLLVAGLTRVGEPFTSFFEP